MKPKLMIAFYPIKPVYVDRIIDGTKKYELRRRLPSGRIDYVLIYSNSPVAKVVGYAKIKLTLKRTVEELWPLVGKEAGISKADYLSYFEGCNEACALELVDVRRFVRPFGAEEVAHKFVVPQSFCYIEAKDFRRLKKRKTENV